LSSIFLPSFLGGTPRPYIIYFMKPANEPLRELAQLAGEGKLVVDIDGGKVRDWDEKSVMGGYERMMSGKTQGKIVVEVGGW
jgi:coenzyme F420-reducing hydrogenase alpha subunit